MNFSFIHFIAVKMVVCGRDCGLFFEAAAVLAKLSCDISPVADLFSECCTDDECELELPLSALNVKRK